MNPVPVNLNLRRRVLPGLLALAAAPALRLLLLPLRKRRYAQEPLLVFSSYMVGDLFMALPALKRLAAEVDLRVACRPDCAEILRREGLDPIPFDNAFFRRPGPGAFLATLRAAWRLRGTIGPVALDLDADPRTALWLRLAGARAISYRRPFGVLFHETFALPPGAVHQADRDLAVAEEFLRRMEAPVTAPREAPGARPSPHHSSFITHHSASPWILSVWTRKPAKNWPLARWEEFMERLRDGGVPFAILNAPDGDAAFRSFRELWRGRAEFVEGPLEAVADRVRNAAGAIATDNFLGHMAGYYGKPVLWINIASPAAQVAPRGPRTVTVEAEDPRRPEALTAETVWRAFTDLTIRA